MEHLRDCLESIQTQLHQDCELIVVDNHSQDGSADWIAENYPDIHLIRSEKNLGFSGGMNLGIRNAGGRYLLLLNQDIVLDSGCFDSLKTASGNSGNNIIGYFPKVVFYQAPGFLNAYGSNWYESCHWRDSRVGLPDLQRFQNREFVFGSIFPAVMLEKNRFLEMGGFDTVFWSYCEDFDVCYRAQIFGYQFELVPDAKIRHKYRKSSRDDEDPLWSRFWFLRNYIMVFLKNYEPRNLRQYGKQIYRKYLGNTLRSALRTRNWAEVRLIQKVIISLVFRLPWIILKRLPIQKRRVKTDQEIWQKGRVEPLNLYHVDDCIVLSMKSMRAAVYGEKFEYEVEGKTYSTL